MRRGRRPAGSQRWLAAAVALSVAPGGFSVADMATRVRSMTGRAEADHTVRQAAYDLGKLRGKQLVATRGRSRRYHVPPDATRAITALLVLRDHVIAPIVAGCRVPMRGGRPRSWTTVDNHYETLRRDMVALFYEVGISRQQPAVAA